MTLPFSRDKWLQNAADETGNGETLNVVALERVAFQVTGTFVGTVTFEATVDGANWDALEVTDLSDSTSLATTATAPGIFVANCKGLAQVRAQVSAYTSGAISVYALASA